MLPQKITAPIGLVKTYAPLFAALAVSTASHAADVRWGGMVNDDWGIGLNWDTGSTPAAGDVIYIDPGTVFYSSGTSPNFRSVRLLGGMMTVSGGELKSSFNSSWDCLVNGTFLHTGGTVDFNELEVGRRSGDTGLYQLKGGDLIIGRGLSGFSLYLGGNHDSNAGGTGTFQVLSGSAITRGGVKLGHATLAGTGIFEVIGSGASLIGIGSQGSGDGWWEQNAGSTLKVRVDAGGMTPIFIDDVEGTNSTYARFVSGALLDVGYFNHGGPGTWTVMEVENGDITVADPAKFFAPGVDTGTWSFNVDNSGANGLLTVTSTAAAPTPGNITWDGSESSDWNDGLNWNNNSGPVTSGDRAFINSGSVVYTAATGVNLRALRLLGGTMTVSSGLFRATSQSSWDSHVNGALYHTGGTVEINELEVGGRSTSNNGIVKVSGGDFAVTRGLSGYSLYLGADHDDNNGGTGIFEISGGSLQTRTGVKLGRANMTGAGTFSVLGSAVTEVGIGSRDSVDGWWDQHAGSTLKVGIDQNGVTRIFIDDVEGANGTYAAFASGALLDVGYYDNGSGPGTWTVMEVENGDITVANPSNFFASSVNTGIWSFNVDNSGANGILTVTSTASPASQDVTWDGSESSDWATGANWNNNSGPYTQGDRAIIHSGSVVYDEAATTNLNALRLFGGSLTITGGLLKATASSNWDSRVDGTLYHVGGTAEFNELEIGSYAGNASFYYLGGGDLTVSRLLEGYSLYLGGNHDSNGGGTGTLEITAGSLLTRTGVKLGHATQAGTGTFAVLGTAASEIGIGSQGSGDGNWVQHSGSTLRVGIDYLGATKIFIDEVDGGSTYATFESGSLLDVDYYNTGGGAGSWIVMEVENGDIHDNGLAFAPGVDTNTWSFSVDNSGPNGILRVTATGAPAGLVLTVGDTPRQQMRYGIDYERLWFWQGSSSVRDRFAEWSVVDCDVDYVRVAINAKYELTEGVYQEDAYFDEDDNEGGGDNNDRIIPMMQDMKDANPDIKFFASPRPLNESWMAIGLDKDDIRWQPYPLWITGSSSYGFASYDFKDIKCAEYLVRYLLMMKHYGFKISYLDVTNEWQNDSGGRLTQSDLRDVHEYLNVTYFDVTVNSSPHSAVLGPWEHPEYPGVTLVPDDIPILVAPSAYDYKEGKWWVDDSLNTQAKRDAVEIASCHNTGKDGTAQEFADQVRETWNNAGETVPEIWNTEVHGWKSTSDADEVLTYAYMLECINAGFSGLNGWLAVGFSNQGHCYIVNSQRSVKYYMFEKLTNTSNRGFALDVNEPNELKDYWDPDPDQADADSAVSALIRGNLMTVWVLNHSDKDHPVTILPTGRTISEFPIKATRWSQFDNLPIEGVTESIPHISGSSVYAIVEDNSAYCFEILLEPEVVPYSRIQAESYDGSDPVNHSTETCSDTENGLNLSNINDGNWVCFDDILLSGATSLRFRIAAPSGRPDGVIEVRLGSETGTVIGRAAVPVTGGWQTWETIEVPIDPNAGTHDVYLKFVEAGSNQQGSGGMFNVNWFEVQIAESPANVAGSPASASQVDLTWDAVDGATGYTVKRSTAPGGPYTIVDDTIAGTSFSDTGWPMDQGLSAGTPYYYVVTSRYDGFESGESQEVSAVPSNPVVIGDVKLNPEGISGSNFNFSVLNSQLGHNYRAQKNKVLDGTGWQNSGSVKPGNGGNLPFSIPIQEADTGMLFRVTVWRQ